VLALARQTTRLKAIPRTGWLDRGVDPRHVESVADHSLGVALLAWACALERREQGADLDPLRVVMLALIHDLPEAETGDVPPYDVAELPKPDDPGGRHAFLDRRHERAEASAAAKRADEDAAMQRLMEALPAASRRALDGLWTELQQGTSAEARFVRQVDGLETFLQSRNYRRGNPGLPMNSFRREVMDTIDDPLLVAIRDAALADDSSG
jgi:putative hydrolase of HD superfamily